MMGLGRVLKRIFFLMMAFTVYSTCPWGLVCPSCSIASSGFQSLDNTANGFSIWTTFPYRMWCPMISTGTSWIKKEGEKNRKHHIQNEKKMQRLQSQLTNKNSESSYDLYSPYIQGFFATNHPLYIVNHHKRIGFLIPLCNRKGAQFQTVLKTCDL